MATVVITGANRGIGLALCKEYRTIGDEVIAVCRNSSPELDSLGVRVISNVDITTDCPKLTTDLEGVAIDILINNAGILRQENVDSLNFDTILEQIQVNSIAPLKVTQSLMGYLSSGSKVAMITSRMGSIADNDSGGYYGYRMSKAALNAASTSLAKDLASRNIFIGIIHPGYVKTDMTGHVGFIESSESAKGIVDRIVELNEKTTGTFWHSNGEILPW